MQCVIEVESKTSKSKNNRKFYGDKVPFKIYTKSDQIDISYNREIRVDIKNAAKVTLSVNLGIYPEEKRGLANFLTFGRSSRPVEKQEYVLGYSTINMEQFSTQRPQSIVANFQLLGSMNIRVATQCYTSSLE